MSIGLSLGRLTLSRHAAPFLFPTPAFRPSTLRIAGAYLGGGVALPGNCRQPALNVATHTRLQHTPLNPVNRIPQNSQTASSSPIEHVEIRPQDFVNEVFPSPEGPQFFAPFVYTILFGVGTYLVAATISIKQTQVAGQAIDADRNPFGNLLSYVRNVDERDLPGGRRESQLHAYKQQMRAEKFGRIIQRVIGVCDTLGFSRESKKEVAKHLTDVAEWYLNLPPSKQVVVPTIGTISAMFVGVNVGFLAAGTSLRKSLFRLVMHVPVSRNHLALTLSVLTHIGIFHMALNSYALWNFDGSSLRARRFVEDENGRIKHTAEASLLPHYVAFFLISGTFASLCAHGEAHLFFRMIQRRSGTSRAMRMVGLVPGIGSSGAAYALVTNWALTHRDEGLMGLIFLPRSWMQKPLEMLTYVLSAELIITILGFVRGRHLTRIGHVAHLGGALFGWLYYRYGNGAWEQTKARVATVARANQRNPETVPRI